MVIAKKRCKTKKRVSYGLIVKTRCGRVVVIERKVPYCVQDYYFEMYKKGRPVLNHLNPFLQVRDAFESHRLPRLGEDDRLDYLRFVDGRVYEDFYDFPHGRPLFEEEEEDGGSGCVYRNFLTAYREFCEETGFKFSFTRKEVYRRYPRVEIEFTGCDGKLYVQRYFVVENARRLRRYRYFDSFDVPLASTPRVESWNDDRLVYRGLLVGVEKAYQIFARQQSLKKDFKHRLLLLCGGGGGGEYKYEPPLP